MRKGGGEEGEGGGYLDCLVICLSKEGGPLNPKQSKSGFKFLTVPQFSDGSGESQVEARL